MNPKKVKKIYEAVAEDLNLNKDLIEDLVEFYYKDVRKLLTNLEYPRINVDGLGQFVAKPKAVSGSIDKITKSLDDHDTSTFKAYHNKKAMEVKLDLLTKLHSKILDQESKKQEFLKTKKDEKRA
jgi:nucleoid DNA-binding protein